MSNFFVEVVKFYYTCPNLNVSNSGLVRKVHGNHTQTMDCDVGILCLGPSNITDWIRNARCFMNAPKVRL